MFVVLWEFEVKPGCEDRFEQVYGAGGDWASLFRRDACYAGTRLFRDATRPRVYLTADYWQSRTAYEAFLARWGDDYRSLDAVSEELTASERRIGWYDQVPS